MIKGIINLSRSVLSLGITLGLFAILIFVMRSAYINENDLLTLAVSADLLVAVPIVYFLLIRKTSIPNATVIPIMMLGLIIGTCFLPKENQTYLILFKTWALPFIETTILALIIYKVRLGIKRYQSLALYTIDFYTALKTTCYEILPEKLVLPLATEIAVIYYGFIDWKPRTLTENEFSYHKKSGTQTLLGVFLFLIGIETFAMHLLLSKWSILVAWILTGLSIYTAIQMLGVLKSLSKRPISINAESLTLRYGILNEVEIPFEDIERVVLSRKPIKQDDVVKKLSPLSELESHNTIIELNCENTLTGLYGFKKNFKVLALHLDKEIVFKESMEKALHQHRSNLDS